MEINRNNYEIFMLDYIEGNLPLDIREDFICFLNNNPDLKEEADDLFENNLVAETIVFHSKDLLKKNAITEIEGLTRFEQLSIAKIENDINLKENKQLDELLANSHQKQIEFQLFQKTKLTPDNSITFPDKNKIKHRKAIISIQKLYYISGIAALILLLVGIGIFYQPNNSNEQGKALSYNYSDKYLLRMPKQIEKVKYQDNNKQIIVNNQVAFEIPQRESSLINTISIKGINAIEYSNQDLAILNIEDLTIYNNAPNEKSNENYLSFGAYLNKQFKEKILKQPANEKATLASVGNAFGRVLTKVFKKEFRIDKKVMDDGSKLYALKAGSLEIYTSTKPSKKSENLPIEKNNYRLNSQKE